MTEGATAGASRENRRAIPISCALHRGPRGFANLVVERKLNGEIVLDPHVTGAREGHPASIPSARMSRTGMTVAWMELRRAAVSAARWGWPVVPGTYLGADRHWHGRDNARRLCPISEIWQNAPVIDPAHAEEIWTREQGPPPCGS